MHIGIDIRPLMSPARSGVGEYTFELLNAIFSIEKTNQYFLFYNSHTDVSQYIPQWKQDNIHYVHKKYPNKLFNAATKIFGVPKIDSTIQNSITLASGNPSPQLDYFFSPNFGFTALTKKTKQILTVHDLSFEFFPEFFSFKQRLWHQAINPKKQCQRATTIICPSENTKRDIISLYKISAEKITVIYPGVKCHPELVSGSQDINGMPKQVRHDTVKKYNLPHKFILFLGTIEPRKNILAIIEAYEKAYSSFAFPHPLVIAGYKGWKDTKIYKRAQASLLKDKIKFIGPIEAQDKISLYGLAELFVYPSFYEGFGFPPLEAMACGTPVITSNRSSLPEVTSNAAYLVNPNRPAELAAAMVEILKNDKLREEFKKRGLEQAKKFSWEKAAREFIHILI